jgi:putative ABC transport system permease protein
MRSDLRLALRALWRRPVFTLLAVITLTIGVGANTAVFGLISAIMLRPLPLIRRPETLVEISRRAGDDYADVSYAVFQAMRGERQFLVDAAAYTPEPASLSVGDDAPAVRMVMCVTGNYFDVLGVRRGGGRLFGAGESFYRDVVPVVVISDRLWHERFGADPGVLGRVLRINGVSLTIIGVTPPAFRGHAAGFAIDAYVPLGLAIPGLPSPSALDDARSGLLQIIARVRPGVTRGALESALSSVATRTLAAAPLRVAGSGPETHPVRVDAFSPVPVVIRGGVSAFLAVLLAISALLLMMTCVNVAGMILSRATERRTEIAVRYSLGATRSRIVRQILLESAMLFLVAGVTGALLAAWATPLVSTFEPPLPAGFALDLDLHATWHSLAYASLVAALSGIVFSLAPALRAARNDLSPLLREYAGRATASGTRMRGLLVGIQMAATVVLLIAAGLFARALAALDSIDPGWNADDVYVTSLDLELNGTDPARGRTLFARLTERVAGIPGVRVAAIASKLPFSGQSSFGAARAEGAAVTAGVAVPAYFNRVSSGYFDAMGIRLLRGRDVRDSDDQSAPNVSVINAAMAERLWPGADPVGRRFVTGLPPNEMTFEVVGVAANSKVRRLNETPPNVYYIPYRQRYNSAMTLIVRLDPAAPRGTVDAVRAASRELAAGLPIEPLRPLWAALQVYFLPQRIAAWVGGLLGSLGLLIAGVGAYGVAAIAVAQRRRELGIRLALGARSADLLSLLVRRVMRAPVIGLVSGVTVAVGLTQPLGRFLGVVKPLDPLTFAMASLGLAAVIALATWLPARRAARMDPVEVLRRE